MNQHTPGPWTIGMTKQGIPGTIRDGLSRVVASLPPAPGGDIGYLNREDLRAGSPYTSEGIAANARLIAAAPDLLEAAYLALEALTVTAAESAAGSRQAAAARVKAKRAIRRVLRAVSPEVPA